MTMLICEACDVLPAAFLCKADSASLCATCDESVHSANPLAGRHHRVPIITTSTAITIHVPAQKEEEDDEEAVSWLLQNPFVKTMDEDYLGIEDYYYHHGPPNNSLQRNDGFSSTNSWQQNDCSSQHHVVPQKGFEDRRCVHLHFEADDDDELFLSPSTVQMAPAQLSPMEREARVMRYREKKKTRRFEKTIRYASRKAYAETRPRIKGRFAKREDARDDNEADEEADDMLRSSSLNASSYGVVPSVSLYS